MIAGTERGLSKLSLEDLFLYELEEREKRSKKNKREKDEKRKQRKTEESLLPTSRNLHDD